MRLFYRYFIFILISASACHGPEITKVGKESLGSAKNGTAKTNFGYNIIVAVDLSNRIINPRRYEDPQIVELVTNKLKVAFQKSIDLGINGKFYLTTVNDHDFANYNYRDSVFKIDLTRFNTDEVARSNYLYHNDTTANSLRYDLEALNSNFKNLYLDIKNKKQLPADIIHFFQDKLNYPIIDTSSKSYTLSGTQFINKYRNYVILLTDGYIEAGRYSNNSDMKEKNKIRFLSENAVEEFRNNYKASTFSDYSDFFKKSKYGIIPFNNDLLKDCKFLVLELYDRSLANGVTTKTPTDMQILKLFWSDWLINSNIASSNFQLKETYSNKQDLDVIINDFLDLK